MRGVAGAERGGGLRHVQPDHQPRLRRYLEIEPGAANLLSRRALQRDVEPRILRSPGLFFRFALVLVVDEEVQPVAEDRAAERPGVLLVLERRDALEDGIRGVEAIVAEVAAERTGVAIGPRLRDQVDLEARGPALRGIEPVRDELELRDHLLAEGGLAAAAHRVLKLLAVDVGLELPDAIGVPRVDPVRVVAGRAAAGREQQQRAPVASLNGHLRHLLRIDVAAEARGVDLEQRRVRGDGHGFFNRRRATSGGSRRASGRRGAGCPAARWS